MSSTLKCQAGRPPMQHDITQATGASRAASVERDAKPISAPTFVWLEMSHVMETVSTRSLAIG